MTVFLNRRPRNANEQRTLSMYGLECISSSVGAFLLRGEVVEIWAQKEKGAMGWTMSQETVLPWTHHLNNCIVFLN